MKSFNCGESITRLLWLMYFSSVLLSKFSYGIKNIVISFSTSRKSSTREPSLYFGVHYRSSCHSFFLQTQSENGSLSVLVALMQYLEELPSNGLILCTRGVGLKWVRELILSSIQNSTYNLINLLSGS